MGAVVSMEILHNYWPSSHSIAIFIKQKLDVTAFQGEKKYRWNNIVEDNCQYMGHV